MLMSDQFVFARPTLQDLEITELRLRNGRQVLLRTNLLVIWRDCPTGLFSDRRIHNRLEEVMNGTERGLERGDLLVAGTEQTVFIYRGLGDWIQDNNKRHLDSVDGFLLYHPDPVLTKRQWVLCGSGSVVTWEKKGVGYDKRLAVLKEHGLVPETNSGPKWERENTGIGRPSFRLKLSPPNPHPYGQLSAPSHPFSDDLDNYPHLPNFWISKIRSHLEGIYPAHSEPLIKCGKALDLLIYRPEPIDTGMKLYDLTREGFYKDYHVTTRSLWEDLVLGGENVEVEEAFTSQGTWRAPDLMSAFAFAGVGGEGFVEGKSWVLGAINVPSHQNGSRKCGILTPNFLKDDGVITAVPNGYFDRGSAFTSTGFLTEPHWDVHGVPELVTHMFGRKLWLVWSPTPGNLEKAKLYFLSPSNAEKLSVEKALELLDDLQLVYCTKENQSFVLEPYAIHAVLSETPCIHFSKLFASYSRFSQYEGAHQAVVDTLCNGCLENGRSLPESTRVIDVLEDGRIGIKYWDVLLKEKADHPLASDTRKWLKDLKKYVADCIKELKTSPGDKNSGR